MLRRGDFTWVVVIEGIIRVKELPGKQRKRTVRRPHLYTNEGGERGGNKVGIGATKRKSEFGGRNGEGC